MKVWAENVSFATKPWKIGSLGFAIVRLSFGYRSLSFAYRLLSFAIVRYRSFIVRYRSPIVRYRSPIIHLSLANRSLSFTKFPVLFACSSLQFPLQLFSAIRFSTTAQTSRFSEKHLKNQLTQPRLQLNPMKLGWTHLQWPTCPSICCELLASSTWEFLLRSSPSIGRNCSSRAPSILNFCFFNLSLQLHD